MFCPELCSGSVYLIIPIMVCSISFFRARGINDYDGVVLVFAYARFRWSLCCPVGGKKWIYAGPSGGVVVRSMVHASVASTQFPDPGVRIPGAK